jgi:hypothetical protein
MSEKRKCHFLRVHIYQKQAQKDERNDRYTFQIVFFYYDQAKN